MQKTPLWYGEQMCRTMMKQYAPEELPPKGAFFYHQGVFLSGMQNVYELTKNEDYFSYAKAYVDSCITKEGEIPGFNHELITPDMEWLQKTAITRLDNRMPCLLLYQIWQKTGERRYKKAIDTLIQSMYYWPINMEGGYWHMMDQPYQMWLDGAYMAGPMCVQYDNFFGASVLRERAIKQIFLMNDHMRDSETGLYFHGWDESKREQWANPKTGLSGQIWGRAVGWYAVAVLDVLELLSKDHPACPRLRQIAKDLLQNLVRFQDKESGLWYQVLDKPKAAGNWLESSCTCLFAYAYAKAMRLKILPENYGAVMQKAYQGIIRSLQTKEDGSLLLNHVCAGTCIESGTYEYYINRPTIGNDLHGAGAFVLMCTEIERRQRQNTSRSGISP